MISFIIISDCYSINNVKYSPFLFNDGKTKYNLFTNKHIIYILQHVFVMSI